MSIESQSTEPQAEETEYVPMWKRMRYIELTHEKLPDDEPNYVDGDFVQVEPVGNPFPNARFIAAMYGELFSKSFRQDGREHRPFPEGFDPATDDMDWGWLKREDMIGCEAMLDDLFDTLGEVETLGWGLCPGWDAAPSAPEYLLKLLAIGQLLNFPFTEKQWARAYDLYDYARQQRRRVWNVPDDDEEEMEAA